MKRKPWVAHWSVALLVLVALIVARPAQGQSQRPESAPGSAVPQLTAADLGAFLDGLVPTAMQANDVAGAVVAVVKDGHLLLARGYGYADVAHRRPIVPDNTVFRVASISKLFTATAVMQLVEAGKLDLDEDVDRYLEFKLPRRFPDKITLRCLLTHTAGFEDAYKQLPAEPGRGVPLADWVRKMTPAQIYRPGTVTSYSNYGVDLAGYVVERVAGMAYAEYIRSRILMPLGMLHASIANPPPSGLQAQIALGYRTASDSPRPFRVLEGEPSGNLVATATDMANFAIAHLQLGRFGEQRILGEETARVMGTTQFRTHPAVPGMGLGFFEENRNGYRIQGHSGDVPGFHSQLSLVMDERVGFFIAINSDIRLYRVPEVLRDAFVDRYFPRRLPLEPVASGAVAQARRFAGTYTFSRRAETTLGRLRGLLLNLDVQSNPDGSLQIPLLTGRNGSPLRWYPIDSTTYRTEDGGQRIGFVPSGQDLPARVAFLGGHELHQVGAIDSRRFSLWVLGGSMAIFAGVLLLWPVAAVVRRRYAVPFPDDGATVGLRAITRIASLLCIVCVVGMAIFLIEATGGTIPLDSRLDPIIAGIRLAGFLGVLGTIASALAFVRCIRRGRNRWAAAKYAALVISGAGFAWVAVHWHLLSANFRY